MVGSVAAAHTSKRLELGLPTQPRSWHERLEMTGASSLVKSSVQHTAGNVPLAGVHAGAPAPGVQVKMPVVPSLRRHVPKVGMGSLSVQWVYCSNALATKYGG